MSLDSLSCTAMHSRQSSLISTHRVLVNLVLPYHHIRAHPSIHHSIPIQLLLSSIPWPITQLPSVASPKVHFPPLSPPLTPVHPPPPLATTTTTPTLPLFTPLPASISSRPPCPTSSMRSKACTKIFSASDNYPKAWPYSTKVSPASCTG